MKSARVLIFLLLTWATAHAQAPFPAAAAPHGQEHGAHPVDVPAMTLEQLEAAALEANPEIKALIPQVAAAGAHVGAAGALEDPSFTYRGWNVPLREPWNLNQALDVWVVAKGIDHACQRLSYHETQGDLGFSQELSSYLGQRFRRLPESRGYDQSGDNLIQAVLTLFLFVHVFDQRP